jgi:RHS repeat-associated protein
MISGAGDPHTFYHADANGNVTMLVSSKQLVVGKYLYDPYGNQIAHAGPLADANVYRFSSKEYHANSGLVYYGRRFYDPNLQRWVNRDPIGTEGGINLYTFVGNSPVLLLDPDGLAIGKLGELIEKAKAAWDAALHAGVPGLEFEAALKVFGGCQTLGLAINWGQRQYNECVANAWDQPPAKQAAAEKACDDKWKDKLNILRKTYQKKCTGPANEKE